MNKIEILAPSGGYDSITAAVRSGADAVYVGLKEFSARYGAKNFDFEELKSTVKYCHESSVKVYLALNTLVFDDEIDKVLNLVRKAALCDIDAVIIQDIGLACAIKKVVPNLKLHASTQMSVHTLSGAKALYEMGFSRVVLSRELTKQEIKYIAENSEVELEVFVHGALCMCLSGQCYMSAALGTRSANRGMCAQPCRLPFSSDNSTTHALSLKDNSVVEYIRELEEIGVCSAKIEGRMKRPEYVAASVRACVEQRDFGFISDKTKEWLLSVFSRTGFTDGYYTDERGHDMFGYRKREDVISASEKLLKEIRNSYKDEANRVDVDFDVNVEVDRPLKLTVSDGKNTVTVVSENVVEKAKSAPITKEKLSSYLIKTGDTVYKVNGIKCFMSADAFVSAKDINALRREALLQLSQKREKVYNYKIFDYSFEDLTSEIDDIVLDKTQNRAVLSDLEIPDSFSQFEYVFVPLFECVKNKKKVKGYIEKGINLAVDIPRAMFSLDDKITDALKEAKEIGISDALCHNIGAVYLCKKSGFDFHLSFAMNITNSLALEWAKHYGAKDVEISFELDIARINLLKKSIPIGVFAYGYLPLMITRNCPVKSGVHTCKTCKNQGKLQDRKGEVFTLKCNNSVTEILNCVPLVLPQELKKSPKYGFNNFHFNVENSVENKEKTLENLSENRNFERFTYGLYVRGVKKFTIF